MVRIPCCSAFYGMAVWCCGGKCISCLLKSLQVIWILHLSVIWLNGNQGWVFFCGFFFHILQLDCMYQSVVKELEAGSGFLRSSGSGRWIEVQGEGQNFSSRSSCSCYTLSLGEKGGFLKSFWGSMCTVQADGAFCMVSPKMDTRLGGERKSFKSTNWWLNKSQLHTQFTQSHTMWWWLLHSCWNPAFFFLRNSILQTCCKWYSSRWCWTGLRPPHQHRWHLCVHKGNYYIKSGSPAVWNACGPKEAWGAHSMAISPEAAPLCSLMIPGCDFRLAWVLHSEVGSHLAFLCFFCPSSLFLGWEPGHVLQIAFTPQQKWF